MDNKSVHILIVDDDSEIRKLVSQYLTQYQYRVSMAEDGEQLQKILARNDDIDLILLDIMMPGEDGFTLCKKIRTKSKIPIIMLTAVDEETDRVLGLELGADDYQTKPIRPRELLARIKAVLRRRTDDFATTDDDALPQEKLLVYEFANWQLDTATRKFLAPDKTEVILSAAEYTLLLTFLQRPQRVLSRDQLMTATHNREAEPFDRSIDVLISRLRHKVELDSKQPELIKTVRSGGYMLATAVKKL